MTGSLRALSAPLGYKIRAEPVDMELEENFDFLLFYNCRSQFSGDPLTGTNEFKLNAWSVLLRS